MKEFKGTKGDWEAKGELYFTIESKLPPTSREIATFPTIATVNTAFISLPEAKANANIIAAAPELLKTLQNIQLSIMADPDYLNGTNQEFIYYVDMAEEVINKALGINE